MTYGDGWQRPEAAPDPTFAAPTAPADPATPPYPPPGPPYAPTSPTYPPAGPRDTIPMGIPTQPTQGYPPEYPTQPPYPAQPAYGPPPTHSTSPTYSAPPAYGTQPGYPYEPPKPTGRRGLTIGLVAAVVLLMVAAGGAAYAFVHNRSTTASSGTTPPFAGDLRTLLLTPPKTSRPFTDPISKDGTLTKKQVADSFDDPTSINDVLDQYHWTGGAIVQWHDADDTQVTIKLYQFNSTDNAQRWLAYNQNGYSQDDSKTDQSPIDGIDGSGLYVAKAVDDKGYVLTNGVATKGGIYMIVFVWQVDRQQKSAAVDLMKQQFARLP
ncbi:MAG: hypothetical protein ACM3JP_00150 [Betaproteobacteria bacterium]